MAVLTDKELFRRIRAAIKRGWIDIPDAVGYRGTGAAGQVLEDQLGVSGGNLDIPDAGKWELKFHSGLAPITMFHLEAKPRGHLREMLVKFGIRDSAGRLSFRHTIWGKSEKGLHIERSRRHVELKRSGATVTVSKLSTWMSASLVLRHRNLSEAASPYWTHDALINAFVGKLRRLIVVTGEYQRKSRRVRFDEAWCFEEPSPTRFISEVAKGRVAIDFDARTKNGTSEDRGIRNHGTKFRIRFSDLSRIYQRITKIE